MRLLPWLFWLCLPTLAVAAPTGLVVDEVRVEGNRRSEADAILGVVATKAGAAFDRSRVRGDIGAIFQLGFYTDIQVDLGEVDGKWVLTYKVSEKPSVRKVLYEGNEEIDNEDLGEVVDIRAFGILDLAKVNRNAEKLKDLYVEKGYFLAEVDWRIVDLPDNEVDVVFQILEKDEVKVAKVTIVGNSALSDDFLKERLETREDNFLAFMSGAGVFQEESFERDQLRVAQFYYDEGYIKSRVGKAKVELSPDRSKLYVTIPVEEGERFKTGELDVTGDFLPDHPQEQVRKLIALKEGEWFSSGKLRQTIQVIGELYKDQGYAYVNIVPNTIVDDDRKVVDLTIDIDKGKKVRFGRIQVLGNSRTRDKVVRRELRIYEGEYYSSSGLRRSKRLVTRLGYFETVDIRTSRGAVDGTMDVIVEVKEKPTGTFQIGAGFSSIESFVAQAQISQNNLFGRGQNLSLQATLSRIRTIANVRFADDYFLDSRVRFATNIYRFETNYRDFTRSSLGGDLTLGYPLSDDWSVAATYTLEQVKVEQGGFGGTTSAPPIHNLFTNGITSSLRLSVFYDTRNNRLFPSSGWFVSGSAEEAADFLLSENEFTRFRVRGRYYYDLGFDMVLKANAQWGLIFSPSESGVPIFERFFVGGPLSVRGFFRNSLGPTIPVPDSNRGDAGTTDFNIGGTEQFIGNLEFEFPIFQAVGIRGVVFTDMGNAFDRREALGQQFDNLRHSWGFGVRWFSPIGPLRFEWGIPFAAEEGEDTSVFDFSIGNFF
jgi:outer membrane protein insertion porin family